ncbi:MAG TPA: paraquat-inducible protein A [Polyangia bacterium]|jgi:paraquat-inducible protein A|nr:paraquat-inducible protein A [Polyangia bacterium]
MTAADLTTPGTAVACRDCSALQSMPCWPPRTRAACFRCGARLVRGGTDRRDHAQAFTLAAIPLFAAANLFPLLQMAGAGEVTRVTTTGAARALWDQGLPALAVLVALTTIALPALHLLATTTLLFWPRLRPAPAMLSRLIGVIRPWMHVEILLLGILVAFGKLATLFHVTPGIGLPSLVGFFALERLALAYQRAPEPPAPRPARDSLASSGAFLIGAAILFVPANLLPVMTTHTLLRSQSDTILSGVVALWRAGSWPLSALVFVASIVVPALKILALALLAISTHARSAWRRGERARLYRLIESIGRWSMLDIFVMALLAALVRSQVAGVEIHPGALAFAAMVVLTMLSSISFDPRLIWAREKGQP